MDKNPFHPGEQLIQGQAGEEHIAHRNGQIIADRIPDGALKFVDKQTFVTAASLDQQKNIWVSLLAGRPGFVQAESPEIVRINTDYLVSAADDIFWTNVANHPVVGLLFIELSTRRRLRLNGPVTFEPDAATLKVFVQECFPLCPRYIQKREMETETIIQGINHKLTGNLLTDELQDWIRGADTFFVGSAHDQDHIDVSHRGGNPGFVQIADPQTLLIPDYKGNGMFNSLGNFSVNPRAGMLFINFETGESLQLTGLVDLQFTEPTANDTTGGTGRYWQFQITSWLRQSTTSGRSWTLLEYSPFNI